MTRVSRLPLGVALAALAVVGPAAQKAPAVPDLLKLGGDCLVQYSQKLNAVAADEEFVQYDTSTGKMDTPKRVMSEIVLLGEGNGTIDSFRDVVAVDNVPVRPKDDRLFDLFKSPKPSSVSDAQSLTQDAVHAYLQENLHVLDQPTVALMFLKPENQANASFKLDGTKTLNGIRTAVLKFTEKGPGHVMTNASAVGRFWIDMTTGAVHQTELGFALKSANVHATVKYAPDQATGLLLPTELYEQIEAGTSAAGMSDMGGGSGMGAHQALEGRAIYSHYRQAKVAFGKID